MTDITHADIELAVQRAIAQARKFTAKLPSWMDKDAFEGEAVAAVAQAINGFDPSKGSAFSTWSHSKVHFALLEEQRRQDPVGRAHRARIKSGEIEETPADLHPMSIHEVRGKRSDKFGGDDGCDLEMGDSIISDAPSPEYEVIAAELRVALAAAISQLPEREGEIIRLRYLEGDTRAQVAARYALSEARIKQCEDRALLRLREIAPELQDYLG